MNTKESLYHDPFDPEYFRTQGHKLVDILADYLTKALKEGNMPVYPSKDPEELSRIFALQSEQGDSEEFCTYIKRIIKYSNHLHHPNYIGHQVTSPLPLSALVQLCTAMLNNSSAIYEMGPVNMAMERNIVQYFGEMIGYKGDYDGFFTHGGTVGNLTSMLCARQNMAGYNIWQDGIKDDERLAFLIPEQSHYSIGRNIKLMGLGDDSAVRVPCDSHFRMRTDLLEETKKRTEDKGIKIISVIANACSTATGSYDNLPLIADFCEKYNLWLHVDGSHGMAVLFSEKYKSLITGAERADSIVIDFHKMLLVPALNTLVMFKNREKSYNTFSQKASYLFKKSQENVWFNGALRTVECTKSAIGIVAFTALKYYSNSYFREYIESRYSLAARFADMVKAAKDFDLATEPDANIICFRYSPKGYDTKSLNRLNAEIRERIILEGSFYIVLAELNKKTWIRLTIINPYTSEQNLGNLLSKIVKTGHEILSESMS